MSSPEECATPGAEEQAKSVARPDSLSKNEPFTAFFSGNYVSSKAVTVPLFKFIADSNSTPVRTAPVDSSGCASPSPGLNTQPATNESTSTNSTGINNAVAPRPLFGPLSRKNEAQGGGNMFSFAAQGIKEASTSTPPANTTKPIFGPLSLNTKPLENEKKFSLGNQNNKIATALTLPTPENHPTGSAVRQVQDSSSRAGQRTASAPLPLMPIVSQVLSQGYGKSHNTGTTSLFGHSADMEQKRRKPSFKTPESSSAITTAPGPSLIKGLDVAVSSSQRAQPQATSNRGPLSKTAQPAP